MKYKLSPQKNSTSFPNIRTLLTKICARDSLENIKPNNIINIYSSKRNNQSFNHENLTRNRHDIPLYKQVDPG